MLFKRFFISLVILSGIYAGYGFLSPADDPLAKIMRQLDKWQAMEPVEKVYLQLDKPYYAAGDDIWFKAYTVSGSDHRLSGISGILNVELVNARGAISQSLKLPLENGLAHGDLGLPDTLSQGSYSIRAYTNYMRNAGSNYFFNKAIEIINTIRPAADTGTGSTAAGIAHGRPDVQFFPEGGYLVNGIAAKVAFKAVAPDGLGTPVKGVITDNNDNEVARMKSAHLGMGEFKLTPVPGASYQARITYADGSENTVALPKAADDGCILSIDTKDAQNLKVKIIASGQSPTNEPDRQLTLVAQNAGKIYYTVKVAPGAAGVVQDIPAGKFPPGIVQFTLFSADGEPMNERLVFIQNNDQLNLTVTGDRSFYSPRQKVSININAQTAGNTPAMGNFSVSVTDETKVPVDEDNENNIMASLLLTSDLRGYVERPAWYFNHVNDETRAGLDMLMLTQGYHRFEWKQILNNVFPPKQYLPENALQVSGTILTPGGKPVINGKVKLFDLDSIQFTRDAITDGQGRFRFSNLTFDDSVRFIIQARNSRNKRDVVIKMDKPEPESTAENKNSPDFEIDISGNLSVYAKSSKQLYAEQLKYGAGNHVTSLQEVVIREKRQAVGNSANLNGPGNADQIVRGRDLRDLDCIHIADCLQGRLVGVVFRNGIPYSTRDFYRPMQVIIDGAYVDGAYLNTLNYFDIQSIEILRNASLTSIYGGQGGSGVFLVTTRNGSDNDYPAPIYGRGITTWFPQGYYKAREFYSPVYDHPRTNKQLADLRTTVFWKPDVVTGTNGKASFIYFNAGSKGTYRLVIEGVDDNGNPGRQVYRYKVQ